MSEIADLLNNKIDVKLSIRQRKIVLGCLLGKSYIICPSGKRSKYFYTRQSKNKDINIIAFRAAELRNLSRHNAFIEDKSSYKWYSMSHTEWDAIYKMCYRKGKKHITMDWLDELTDISLVMVILDLGGFEKDHLLLNTKKFGRQNSILKRYFNEVGYECSVKKNKIHFTRQSTIKLLQDIQQQVPEYLLYLIQQYIP